MTAPLDLLLSGAVAVPGAAVLSLGLARTWRAGAGSPRAGRGFALRRLVARRRDLFSDPGPDTSGGTERRQQLGPSESADQGVMVTDRSGRVLEANEAQASLLGVATADELKGRPWASLLAEPESLRLADEVAEALASRGRWEGQMLGRGRDGAAVLMLVWVKALGDGRALHVSRDITERDRLQRQLMRLSLAVDAAGDGIAVVDPLGQVVYANAAYARAFGFATAEAALTSHWGSAYRDTSAPAGPAAMTEEVRATGRSEGTLRGARPGGGEFVHRVSLTAIADGQVLVVVGDETERERTLLDLRASEERFRLVAHATRDTIVDLDCASGRMVLSGAIEQMLQITGPLQEVDAEALRARIHPEDRPRVCAALEQTLASEHDSWHLEYRIARADGSFLDVLERGHILRDPAGRPLRTVSSLMDVGERRERERELAAARAEAEAANSAKSVFLANMSHEIRTPMNGVVGMVDLLLRDPELTATQRHFAETIETSSDRLLQIINDVLDLSKIEVGKLTLREEPFDLARLVSDVGETFAAAAHQQGLTLDTHVRPDVPRPLVGDSGRLTQVLANLVGNALKFTPPGGWVSVRASARRDAGRLWVHIDVADTGIGIPEDQAERLFLPFSQLDESSTRQYGGTGLGLAICRELVEMMGGRVEVRSTVGRGSCFSVHVPVTDAVADGASSPTEGSAHQASTPRDSDRRLPYSRNLDPEPSPDLDPEPSPALVGRRLLLVEDDPINQEVAELMLLGLGVEIAVAADGQEALHLLAAGQVAGVPYDAVLMDVHLPVLDGLEATRRIRAAEAESARSGGTAARLPVIAMTASALEHERRAAHDAGMDDFLPKPVSIRCLETVLTRWVGST